MEEQHKIRGIKVSVEEAKKFEARIKKMEKETIKEGKDDWEEFKCKHLHKDAPFNMICEDCGKPWN